MTKQSGGRPTTERAAEIKAIVLAATMEAFVDKGSAFSMDEVALLAGVSKQAIYRRWRTKIDLVVEIIEGFLGEWLERPSTMHDDPVGALEELARHHFSDDPMTSNRLAVYLQAESFHNDHLRDRLVEWHRRLVDTYSLALREIDKAGRRVPGDPRVQAQLLVELLNGGTQWLALNETKSSIDQRRCFDERWNAFKRIALC